MEHAVDADRYDGYDIISFLLLMYVMHLYRRLKDTPTNAGSQVVAIESK